MSDKPKAPTQEAPAIDPKMKKEIDAMSYESLLSRWRNAPFGDAMFQGEVFAYYSEVMKRKRGEVGPAGHTAISKAIGWGDGE